MRLFKLIAPIGIKLNSDDILLASAVGELRYSESRRIGCVDRTGGTPSLEKDIIGAIGELAFCRGMQITWRADVNTFKKPDVLSNTQVRTSPYNPSKHKMPIASFGRMILRPGDNPANYYALIVGSESWFLIQGWALGRNVMVDKWLKAEANRPPAWFVPHRVLNKDFTAMHKAAQEMERLIPDLLPSFEGARKK